jgi:hypothetical protein
LLVFDEPFFAVAAARMEMNAEMDKKIPIQKIENITAYRRPIRKLIEHFLEDGFRPGNKVVIKVCRATVVA